MRTLVIIGVTVAVVVLFVWFVIWADSRAERTHHAWMASPDRIWNPGANIAPTTPVVRPAELRIPDPATCGHYWTLIRSLCDPRLGERCLYCCVYRDDPTVMPLLWEGDQT